MSCGGRSGSGAAGRRSNLAAKTGYSASLS